MPSWNTGQESADEHDIDAGNRVEPVAEDGTEEAPFVCHVFQSSLYNSSQKFFPDSPTCRMCLLLCATNAVSGPHTHPYIFLLRRFEWSKDANALRPLMSPTLTSWVWVWTSTVACWVRGGSTDMYSIYKLMDFHMLSLLVRQLPIWWGAKELKRKTQRRRPVRHRQHQRCPPVPRKIHRNKTFSDTALRKLCKLVWLTCCNRLVYTCDCLLGCLPLSLAKSTTNDKLFG